MKSIYKYILEPIEEQEISLPKGAKILTAHEQHGRICIWALVTVPETEIEERVICIYGTGDQFSEEGIHTYIGTVFLQDGNYVFHVFEKEG